MSNNSIVCLTRGYKDLARYETLITRNKCIYKFFINLYPLIIFHEGNITDEAQKHITEKSNLGLSAEESFTIKFINIAEVWDSAHGYESMCRFHAFHIWNYCNGYDYVLRIDEDCHLIKCDIDPFTFIHGDENGNVYLRSVYWDESHSETNATLPGIIEKLTGVSREVFYNRKYPYTNVSLSSVQFWLQPTINGILKQIAVSPEQTANRFGDLPILGSLLNIFAKDKVGVMTGLSYYHQSHNNTIVSE